MKLYKFYHYDVEDGYIGDFCCDVGDTDDAGLDRVVESLFSFILNPNDFKVEVKKFGDSHMVCVIVGDKRNYYLVDTLEQEND